MGALWAIVGSAAAGKPWAARQVRQAMKTAGRAGKAAAIRQAAGHNGQRSGRQAGQAGGAARQDSGAKPAPFAQNGRVLYYFRQAKRAADRHRPREN